MQYSYWKHSYPLKRNVQICPSQLPLETPLLVTENSNVISSLLEWLTISHIREQRRYLETHQELLNPQCETTLSDLIKQDARPSKQALQIQDDLFILQNARARGGTEEAIREAYVNVYGGFAIDLPSWLEEVEQRLGDLLDEKDRLRTAEQRVALLLDTLKLVQEDLAHSLELVATLQRELAVAWCEHTRTNRMQAFETALSLCEEVAQTYTLLRYPRQYAEIQTIRGNIYQDRIAGVVPKNMEQALICYQEALQIFTSDAFPVEYAVIQADLGTAYVYRRAAELRESVEQGFVCYYEALRMFTLDFSPYDYARVQTNIAVAYWQRPMGEKRENLEQAIFCLQQALRVWTSDAFPIQWARLQHNLGLIYSERLAGEKQENIEHAIAYTRRALSVFTRDAFPVRHGQGLLNLGNMYMERITGGEQENLEQAITCFEQALCIRTLDAFPWEYATTQADLGIAYLHRIVGEKQKNLQKARACFEQALLVWKLEVSPRDCRRVSLRLAEVEAQCGNWSAAHDAYSLALEAEDLLIILGSDIPGRDLVLKEGRDAAIRDGYVLYRLGRIAEAAVAIERGRARGLTEAMAFNSADPSHISDPERCAQYTQVRQALIAAQAAMHIPQPQDGDNETQRLLKLRSIASYRQAKDAFDQLVTEIRLARDPADFLDVSLDATTILGVAEHVGRGHALVYLLATPWGGVAIAACSAHPASGLPARFVAMDLPDLTEKLVTELIETRLNDGSKRVIGGFALAQIGEGVERLLQDWPSETLLASAQALHAGCQKQQQISTLDTAMQEALKIDLFASLARLPLASLKREERGLLDETLAEVFLRHELHRCLESLSKFTMHPVICWLNEQGATSLTIIPCGYFAAFPLASIVLSDGKFVSERLPASIAPCARSLLHSQIEASSSRKGVYALGDPSGNLPWSEAEALTFTALARRQRLPTSVQLKQRATRDWLLTALRTGRVVDACCHGVFDPRDVLRSALQLAQRERITMGEMLSHQADLRGLRLLMLSACQTAILDLQGARDEMRNLAAAMLQAGAKAVLASLWAVDDKATYLLMVRFAQEWFPHMEQEQPVVALARAQAWLRNVTNAELKVWQSTMPKPPRRWPSTKIQSIAETQHSNNSHPHYTTTQERLLAVRGRALRYTEDDAQMAIRIGVENADPSDHPYADPYYWAGFQVVGW